MNIANISLAFLSAVSILLQNTPADVCSPVEPSIMLSSEGEVDVITVEEYVVGVVAHEVPHTFDTEALKAQAVAARTYLYYCLLNNSHQHDNADVCTDITHCCGYITVEQLSGRYGEKYAKDAISAARDAAYSTEGEVLLYEDKPILSLWHSSSWESTEDCEAVFSTPLPYLVSRPTPESASSRTVSYTKAEVRARLEAAGFMYNGSLKASRTETPSGRCASLTVGNVTLSGTEARWIFGLRSTDFGVYTFGTRIYFLVNGYGHGVGMSQYGADTMAKSSASYEDILTHYYIGTVIGKWE